MRSIIRVGDMSINSVATLLADAGKACEAFRNETMQNVCAKRLQCDDTWSFCYAKQKNVATDKSERIDAGDL